VIAYIQSAHAIARPSSVCLCLSVTLVDEATIAWQHSTTTTSI